ncbi:MAG: MerR family transcriptional regulator [Candidatus Limnocylindrales bacterium]
MSPTNPPDARYTLTDLADLAGVTPRTVRYYLAQGLLPTVGAAGRAPSTTTLTSPAWA